MFDFNSTELSEAKRYIEEHNLLLDEPEVFAFVLFDAQRKLYTGKPDTPWSTRLNDAFMVIRCDQALDLATLAQLPTEEVFVGILFFGNEGDDERVIIPYDTGMTVQEINAQQRRKTIGLVQ